MTVLDPAPTPERELPASRRAAIRDLLVTHAAGAHHPRPVLVTRRRVAFAVASLAGILAATQFWLTPDGGPNEILTPQYVAAWSPIPTPVDEITADELGDHCRDEFINMDATVPVEGWDHLIIDRRGDAAIVLVVNPSAQYAATCNYQDLRPAPDVNADAPVGRQAVSGYLDSFAPLADGESLAPEETSYVASSSADSFTVGYGFGQAASEIARVMVILGDGTEVQATLSDGWYLAWWPGLSDGHPVSPNIDPSAEAIAIVGYDNSGTELVRHDPRQGR
jgi:hypothetical protein